MLAFDNQVFFFNTFSVHKRTGEFPYGIIHVRLEWRAWHMKTLQGAASTAECSEKHYSPVHWFDIGAECAYTPTVLIRLGSLHPVLPR